jgi:NodT family efflux transporter outer membrane factor (OMF) lipoprotein
MEAQKEFAKDVLITVMSDIARNYIEIRSLQNRIDLYQKRIDVQKQLFRLVLSRYEAGLDNERELQLQKEELKSLEQELVVFQTLIKQTYYRLAVLLGKQPEDFSMNIQILANVPMMDEKFLCDLPSNLLRKRPDIRQAERELAAATERIGAAVADYFPTFSLTGKAQLESNKVHNWFTYKSFGWDFGGLMDWPIINFGRVRAQVDEKKSLQKQALLNYEKTIIEALQDVEGSLIVYYNAKKNFDLKNEELLAMQVRRDLTYDLYLAGLVNLNAYLQLEKQYLLLQSQKIDRERAVSTNLVALYKALGGGW